MAKKNENKQPRVLKQAGLNRFLWDMCYPDPAKVEEGFMGGEAMLLGPVAAPGTYSVRLVVGDWTRTVAFEIQKDPRVPATQQDLGSSICAAVTHSRQAF